MKLLTTEELGGIDSTSKTIEKWDEFLKKAVWNLGFRQSLIDGMYPYEAGIPMMDGTTMPVSEKTGRVFFKMSWAEKLCGALSCYKLGGSSYVSNGCSNSIRSYAYLMLSLWVYDVQTFLAFFPDKTEEDYVAFVDNPVVVEEESGKRCIGTSFDLAEWNAGRVLWEEFIDNCDIYSSNLNAGTAELDDSFIGYLTDAMKSDLRSVQRPTDPGTDSYLQGVLYFYYKPIENNYTAFPKQALSNAIDRIFSGYDAGTKWSSFNEVYLQDYLVISLNPIDKLMCSTKQAFSSCMSIAKQDDTRGTASAPALGLPAIFPTDAIYMVFMTPGKHKNMYWESAEWEKIPENRDKEKAYKYLKMTCRALTYKVRPSESCKHILDRLANRYIGDEGYTDLQGAINAFNVTAPRLMVGRQYSTRGEDYTWEAMVELFLARVGISTSLGYSDPFMEIKRKYQNREISIPQAGAASRMINREWLRVGNLTDHKMVVSDRYGYRRGIYYDNLTIQWALGTSSPCDREWLAVPVEENGCHRVIAGVSRVGSHGVMDWTMNSETDMFKVMMGTMSYSKMNRNVKVCAHCGEVLTGAEVNITTRSGDRYCKKCAEELNYQHCSICNIWYSPDEAKDHETLNLRKVLNPSNWDKFPEMIVCKSHLRKATPGSSDYLCAHCGKMTTRYYGSYSSSCLRMNIEGVEVQLVLCDECMKKAVMCDKCRRVLFLDSVADACILLPKRRVICPDCIDSIRLKQDDREKLKAVLERKEASDFDVDTSSCTFEPRDLVGQCIEDEGRRVGHTHTLIKDAHKQITSFLKAHPEETFPVLKSSNPPLSENTEVDDTEDLAIPF